MPTSRPLILVIGGGSIGERHVRTFLATGRAGVIATPAPSHVETILRCLEAGPPHPERKTAVTEPRRHAPAAGRRARARRFAAVAYLMHCRQTTSSHH